MPVDQPEPRATWQQDVTDATVSAMLRTQGVGISGVLAAVVRGLRQYVADHPYLGDESEGGGSWSVFTDGLDTLSSNFSAVYRGIRDRDPTNRPADFIDLQMSTGRPDDFKEIFDP